MLSQLNCVAVYESGKHAWKTYYPQLYAHFSSVLPDPENAEPLCYLVAGGLAEVASATIWIPTDIVSQKLMVQGPLSTPKYGGVFGRRCVLFAMDGPIVRACWLRNRAIDLVAMVTAMQGITYCHTHATTHAHT
jgi:Mitochondrial carrier protein